MSYKIFATLVLMASSWAIAAPKTIKTCIDSRSWLPYTNPDLKNPGLMQVAVHEAGKKLGIKIVEKALPWETCQASVKAGSIDAMIGAAYVDFNREFADFPQTLGRVDSRRSLGSARILFVRKKGSKASFDGKVLGGVTKPIGVAAGTQVMILEAKKFGKVDDGAKTDEENIQKLLDGRIDVMAGYAFDLKVLIDSKYEDKVEILPVPLVETFYYLAFSKKFTVANKEFAEKIWDEIGKN